MKSYFALVLVLLLPMATYAAPCSLDKAWSDWKNGNLEEALSCAKVLRPHKAEQASRDHLLLKLRFAMGEYQEVVRQYTRIPTTYLKHREVIELAIQAHLHRLDYDQALTLAETSGVTNEAKLTTLRQMATYPASFHLDAVDIIPFKDDELNSYIPSFEMEIDGEPLVGQIDTGGSHIAISQNLADELGIDYVSVGEGNANDKPTEVWLGHADFRISQVLVKNAPIYVLKSLNDSIVERRPIFGTTFLSKFLVTLDYPKQRMILSPRGNRRLNHEHLALLPKAAAKMDFYLWEDHYMFARGSIGANQKLNFFVDTGLVVADDSGKQASFYGSTATFQDWGYAPDTLKNPIIDLQGPLRLGVLEQDNQTAFHTEHFPVPSLGGIKIHGLIAHGFLKKYTWTLDFDNHCYLFSN